MYIYYKHEIMQNIHWKLFTETVKRTAILDDPRLCDKGKLLILSFDFLAKKNFWHFVLIFLSRWATIGQTCHHKTKSWCANITQTFYPHLPGLSTMKKLWKCVPCNSSLNLPKSDFVTSIFSMNLSNVSFSDLTNILYTNIHLILFPEEGKVD